MPTDQQNKQLQESLPNARKGPLAPELKGQQRLQEAQEQDNGFGINKLKDRQGKVPEVELQHHGSLTKVAYLKQAKHIELKPQPHVHTHPHGKQHRKPVLVSFEQHPHGHHPVSSGEKILQMNIEELADKLFPNLETEAMQDSDEGKPLRRKQSIAKESSVDFKRLKKRNESAVAAEMKRLLLAESNISQISRKSRREDGREFTEMEANLRRQDEGESTPEEEVICCGSRNAKKKKLKEKSLIHVPHELGSEIWMYKLQRLSKWLVIVVAVMDFCFALEEVYRILIRRMKFEFLFIEQVYNCIELLPYGFLALLLTHIIHGVLSVALLFMTNKRTCIFALYWIISQIILFHMMLMEAYFSTRFAKKDSFKKFIRHWGPTFAVDLVQLFIVAFRFYKLYNPYHLRLKDLAASATVDRSMNSEIHLRTSPFLQSKAAVRQAATFETLAVVNKLHDIHLSSGVRPDQNTINREISLGIQLLRDRTRYPRSKVLNDIAEELRLTAAENEQNNS